MGELLEQSVVDLKSAGTNRLRREHKVKELRGKFVSSVCETFRLMVLVVRRGEFQGQGEEDRSHSQK